ncbi:DNA-directed RNA polymerase subunit D [Candidatus Woesearchaeota archaeon]|nr:DNA-directed RNA polymerase subunit D [Candidatus Woesearchaeota archaeon]
MDVDVIDKTDNKLILSLEKISPGYSNALRRIILAEVPTMAMEDIEFRDNSSALYDEIIAHRLGLIPLTTDLKTYNEKTDCKCKGEGCARCQLKLILKEDGPKTVYAKDLNTTDPKVVPVYEKTIIVKLLKNQSLEFEATAELGRGKVHSKWSPGHIYYKIKPIINVDNRKIKDPQVIKEVCPVGVFDVKKGKLVVIEKELYKCHNCEGCTDLSDGITIEENEEDYIFYVESWGQLAPKDMILKGIDVFDEKLEEFRNII